MPAKVTGLYRRKGEKTFSFDFRLRNHRFCGLTEFTNRAEAEKWLAEFKAKKAQDLKALDGHRPMDFGAVSSRWFREKGQFRRDARDVKRFLAWLQSEIGMGTPIATIDDNRLAQLVAKRRAQGVSAATVNRSCVEPLRAILRRAELWGQRVKRIDWAAHKQKEAPERIREISDDTLAAFFAELRPDFHEIVRFLLAQGLRRAEACNLRWLDVDLDHGRILVRGKGDTLDYRALSAQAAEIVRAQVGRHKTHVFTYAVRHAWGGTKGDRARILPDTLSTAIWRARKAAGLTGEDMRLHDMRHTLATRVLRATNNLRAVQRALGHKRITTTQRYAHVTDDDLRAALDAAAPAPLELSAIEPKRKEGNK